MTERLNFSSDSRLRRRFMVTDEAVAANLRAGVMLEVLDKLAEVTALRYIQQFEPGARVVTAALDDLEVRNAPDIDQDILLLARINFVGRTSMEVGIRIEQDVPNRLHIASCFFTMVARMEGRSLAVPPLEYNTEQENRRSKRAEERRAERLRNHAVPSPTLPEYALLHNLHRELDTASAPLLTIRNLVTSGWERTYPEFENVPQTIFGGHVIHHAYMYAHICAEMIADHRALLVSSSRIDFYQPVRMGDKLHFVSHVTYTGRTSIAVETSITRISRDRLSSALSNTCVFTFVNVDTNLRPMPVERVFPSNYAEDERYLAAYRRHQTRLKRRGEATD